MQIKVNTTFTMDCLEASLSIYKKLGFETVAAQETFTEINRLTMLCSFIEIIKEVSNCNRSKLSAQFHSTSVLLDYLTIVTLLRDTSILRK